MAFFEFLASIGETLSSSLGKFIKPVGGRGLGGYVPSPRSNPPIVSNQTADVVGLDKGGSWVTRSQVLTDEGSFNDDFPGSSLTTALTGTPSFTNGSTTVGGTGTAYTTELTTNSYIKRDSDGDTAWARVAQVLSDTSVVLETAYTGTTGGSASSSSNWFRTVGSGGTISVASGSVTIASGTTNGSISRISRSFDYQPFTFRANLSLSQRIVNQSFFIGFRDSVSSATQAVGLIFDGTSNTSVKFRSQNGTAGSEITERTVTLPFSLTTASTLSYKVDVTPKLATFALNGVVVAKITEHMIGQYTNMSFVIESQNTGVPAGSTNFVVDLVQLTNFNQAQVGNITAGDALPVQIREEVHYISAALTTGATTADQEILTYTVPTGQVAYLVGFSVSTQGNTDGLPVKIGKNTVTTEPASPGTVDANIFRMFMMLRASSSDASPVVSGDFSAMPRPIGNAGDVLKVTVTPSGTGSTIWRATLDIVLRAGS